MDVFTLSKQYASTNQFMINLDEYEKKSKFEFASYGTRTIDQYCKRYGKVNRYGDVHMYEMCLQCIFGNEKKNWRKSIKVSKKLVCLNFPNKYKIYFIIVATTQDFHAATAGCIQDKRNNCE